MPWRRRERDSFINGGFKYGMIAEGNKIPQHKKTSREILREALTYMIKNF